MLRILGAALIVFGCVGMGMSYRMRLREGLWHIRYMHKILELFLSEISFGRSTLPECCRNIGEKMEEPYKTALLLIGEQTFSGDDENERRGEYAGCEKDFFAKWEEHMGKALAHIPVTKAEKEMLVGLSGCFGVADHRMQIRTIEQYRDMLSGAIKNREEALGGQERLATGLGIMSGILLTVILL